MTLPARIDDDPGIDLDIDLDAKVKKALDDLARKIGRSAVNHLKDMYPEALASVTKNAEISLTNHVRNQINFEMQPIVKMLVLQYRALKDR